MNRRSYTLGNWDGSQAPTPRHSPAPGPSTLGNGNGHSSLNANQNNPQTTVLNNMNTATLGAQPVNPHAAPGSTTVGPLTSDRDTGTNELESNAGGLWGSVDGDEGSDMDISVDMDVQLDTSATLNDVLGAYIVSGSEPSLMPGGGVQAQACLTDSTLVITPNVTLNNASTSPSLTTQAPLPPTSPEILPPNPPITRKGSAHSQSQPHSRSTSKSPIRTPSTLAPFPTPTPPILPPLTPMLTPPIPPSTIATQTPTELQPGPASPHTIHPKSKSPSLSTAAPAAPAATTTTIPLGSLSTATATASSSATLSTLSPDPSSTDTGMYVAITGPVKGGERGVDVGGVVSIHTSEAGGGRGEVEYRQMKNASIAPSSSTHSVKPKPKLKKLPLEASDGTLKANIAIPDKLRELDRADSPRAVLVTPSGTSSKLSGAMPILVNPGLSQPSSSRSSLSKPSGSKPNFSRSLSLNPSLSNPSSPKPSLSKPSSSKLSLSNPSSSRPNPHRPMPPNPSSSKPNISKPSTSKPNTSKPPSAKAGPSKFPPFSGPKPPKSTPSTRPPPTVVPTSSNSNAKDPSHTQISSAGPTRRTPLANTQRPTTHITPSPHSSPLFTPITTPTDRHPGDDDVLKLFTPDASPVSVLTVLSSEDARDLGPRLKFSVTGTKSGSTTILELSQPPRPTLETVSSSSLKRKHSLERIVEPSLPKPKPKPKPKPNLTSSISHSHPPTDNLVTGPLHNNLITRRRPPKRNLAYVSIPPLTRPQAVYVKYEREAKLVAKMRSLGIAVETRRFAESLVGSGSAARGSGSKNKNATASKDKNGTGVGGSGVKKMKIGVKEGNKRKRDDVWWDDSGMGKGVGGGGSPRKVQKLKERSTSKTKAPGRGDDDDDEYDESPRKSNSARRPRSRSRERAVENVIDLTMDDGDDHDRDNVAFAVSDSRPGPKTKTVLKDKANARTSVQRAVAKSPGSMSKPKSTVGPIAMLAIPMPSSKGTSMGTNNNIVLGKNTTATGGPTGMLPPPPPPRPKPRPIQLKPNAASDQRVNMALPAPRAHLHEFLEIRTTTPPTSQVEKPHISGTVDVDADDELMRELSTLSDVSDISSPMSVEGPSKPRSMPIASSSATVHPSGIAAASLPSLSTSNISKPKSATTVPRLGLGTFAGTPNDIVPPCTPSPSVHHPACGGSLFSSPALSVDSNPPVSSLLFSTFEPPSGSSSSINKAKRSNGLESDREYKRRKHVHNPVTVTESSTFGSMPLSDAEQSPAFTDKVKVAKTKLGSTSIWASSFVPINSKRQTNHLCPAVTRLNLGYEFPNGGTGLHEKKAEAEVEAGTGKEEQKEPKVEKTSDYNTNTMKPVYWKSTLGFFDLRRGALALEDLEEDSEDSEAEGEQEDVGSEGECETSLNFSFSRGVTIALKRETRVPIGEDWDDVVTPLPNYSKPNVGSSSKLKETQHVSQEAPVLHSSQSTSSSDLSSGAQPHSNHHRPHAPINTSNDDGVPLPSSSSAVKKRKQDQHTSSSPQKHQSRDVIGVDEAKYSYTAVVPSVATSRSSSSVVDSVDSVGGWSFETSPAAAPDVENVTLSAKVLGKRKADLTITTSTTTDDNDNPPRSSTSSPLSNPLGTGLALSGFPVYPVGSALLNLAPFSVNAARYVARQRSMMKTPLKDKEFDIFIHQYTDMSPDRPFGNEGGRDDDGNGTSMSASGSTHSSGPHTASSNPNVSHAPFSDVVGGSDSLMHFDSQMELGSQMQAEFWDMYEFDPVERAGDGNAAPTVGVTGAGDRRFTTIDPTLLGGGVSAEEVLEAGLNVVERVEQWELHEMEEHEMEEHEMEEHDVEDEHEDDAEDEHYNSGHEGSDYASDESDESGQSEDDGVVEKAETAEKVVEKTSEKERLLQQQDEESAQMLTQDKENHTAIDDIEKEKSDQNIAPAQVSCLPSPSPSNHSSHHPPGSFPVLDHASQEETQLRKSTRERKESARKRQATPPIPPSKYPPSRKFSGVTLSNEQVDANTKLASYESITSVMVKQNSQGCGQLTYCHQCRRPTNIVMLGCNTCQKRFCIRCLALRYLALQFDFLPGAFTCPACSDFCNCTACMRKRREEYIPGIIEEAPLFFDDESNTSSPPPPPIIDSLDLTAAPPSEVEFWGAIYNLQGEKIGSAVVAQKHVARGHIPVVYARTLPDATLGPPPTKRQRTQTRPLYSHTTTRVFVGLTQHCWGLGSNPKTKVLDKIPRVKKGVHSYVGNRKLLKCRVIPSQLDDMSDLSSLSSSDEEDEDENENENEDENENENGSPENTDVGLSEPAPDLVPSTNGLEAGDVARAISMALEACGQFTKLDDRNNVLSV